MRSEKAREAIFDQIVRLNQWRLLQLMKKALGCPLRGTARVTEAARKFKRDIQTMRSQQGLSQFGHCLVTDLERD
jgi:hypothetical protein